MSWPDEIWAPWREGADPATGMAPYGGPNNPAVTIGTDAGLPDDWLNYDIKGVSVWDALDNPLYAVAAEAKGIDWEDFKSRVNTQIGPEDDYEFEPSEMVTTTVGARSKKGGGYTGGTSVTYNKDHYDAAMEEWRNSTGKDISDIRAASMDPFIAQIMHDQGMPNKADFAYAGPQINKYGFSGTTGTIYDDIDKMYNWLDDTGDEADSKSLSEMAKAGPQGSDYGIEGDIWSHYGLDKPPTGPVTLADSHFSHKDSIRMPGIEWQDPNHPNPYSQYHTDGTVHAGLKDTWINAAVDLGSDSSMTIDEAFDKA